LAVSKRLVEMMGGSMWAESAGPGQGATFHFTIVAPVAAEVKARPYLRGEQPQLANRRALIVDDNATNRRILAAQTRSWGMEPHATGLPAEALAWLRRGDPFDVAILDLHMLEMTGLELAAAIRAAGAGSPCPSQDLPLILTSSLGGREAAGDTSLFAAYLVKPIRPSALFDALMNVLAGQPAPVAQPPAAPRPARDPEMASRHPLRILLAEDNAVNQKLALRLLAQMGYRADVAANGLEAVQAVERQPYDVLFMDVQMPEMDGLEATRQICQRWPAAARPRIIAMTANALQGDRELCLEAGMDDYLAKPIRVDELSAALARCQPLARHGAPAAATAPPGYGAIDRAVLEQLLAAVGGDRAFLDEMVTAYGEDANEQIAALQAALAAGDADTVRRAAHSLKSTSASFGATQLAAACKELETLAKSGDLDHAATHVAQIELAYAAAEAALKAIQTDARGHAP
jgi:CheY-like chemotaxis protein